MPVITNELKLFRGFFCCKITHYKLPYITMYSLFLCMGCTCVKIQNGFLWLSKSYWLCCPDFTKKKIYDPWWINCILHNYRKQVHNTLYIIVSKHPYTLVLHPSIFFFGVAISYLVKLDCWCIAEHNVTHEFKH